MPLPLQGPSAYAWALLTRATCSEEQIDATALLAMALQKQFDNRADRAAHLLPTVSLDHAARTVLLGGGGCGKTYLINAVMRPLIQCFYGENSYLAQCASNAGARLLSGQTVHTSSGISPTSSLTVAGLRPKGTRRAKLETTLPSIAGLVLDEVSQILGSLLHANSLSFTYGRSQAHSLSTQDYMKPHNTFGALPAVVFSGNFLQLPPVPSKGSVLLRRYVSAHEQRQGRSTIQDSERVYEFTSLKRFTDSRLPHILTVMRVPGGQAISEEAWQALASTKLEVIDWKPDQRLQSAANWIECGYPWSVVAFAQHLRSRVSAAMHRKLLYYIQAIDRASHECSHDDYV